MDASGQLKTANTLLSAAAANEGMRAPHHCEIAGLGFSLS